MLQYNFKLITLNFIQDFVMWLQILNAIAYTKTNNMFWPTVPCEDHMERWFRQRNILLIERALGCQMLDQMPCKNRYLLSITCVSNCTFYVYILVRHVVANNVKRRIFSFLISNLIRKVPMQVNYMLQIIQNAIFSSYFRYVNYINKSMYNRLYKIYQCIYYIDLH